MAQPSMKIVLNDTAGSVGAYVVVQVIDRIVRPDPEKWTDELAVAAFPLALAVLAPPKWQRQAAACGGAAMYPLLTRVIVQSGLLGS